jgi:dihydroorotate dehydrogenase
MQRFLISPPFGNYISHSACTRIRGSYTWHHRPGLIYHTLRSLRPTEGGWVNQIGLRNKGLENIGKFNSEQIYSLVGLEADDWQLMFDHIRTFHYLDKPLIELNLGCPNVHKYGIPLEVLKKYCHFYRVIAKLPATDKIYDTAAMCVETGVDYLHCSNTLPTPDGGESGDRLFEFNLPIVARMAQLYPAIPIIAGGGIKDITTLKQYHQAGARIFSLATIWLTPWRAIKLLKQPALSLLS